MTPDELAQARHDPTPPPAPTLVFDDEVWNLLVTYGRMPADAPGLSAPGHVRVTWSALTPAERGQLYRSLVRCASRAPSRALRCAVSDQLLKLRPIVAEDPS